MTDAALDAVPVRVWLDKKHLSVCQNGGLLVLLPPERKLASARRFDTLPVG